MIEWLVDSIILGASLEYLGDLRNGWARKDWGFEVMVYWPEVEEVVELWSKKHLGSEGLAAVRLRASLQDRGRRPGGDAA